MSKFLLKVFVFLIVSIAVLGICLFFLPDHKSEKTALGAVIDKHLLLSKSKSPKLILVGGSNVSLGFDSKLMSDSLKMPVVNSAISGWFGLQFIISDIKPYIHKGDIVVLSVAYSSFEKIDDNDFNGKEMLVPVLFNIYPKSLQNVDIKQWIRIFPFLGHFITSKIKQVFLKETPSGIYLRSSYNKYGDFVAHWNLPISGKSNVKPENKCQPNEQLIPDAIPLLQGFKKYVQSKGATLIILPPSLQAASFDNQKYIIDKIDSTLKKNQVPFAANPVRYRFSDKFIFDYEYHLNRNGVVLNTEDAISDILKTEKSR